MKTQFSAFALIVTLVGSLELQIATAAAADPVINSISPTSVPGAPFPTRFAFTLRGSGFSTGAKVRVAWNNDTSTPEFIPSSYVSVVNSTQINFSVATGTTPDTWRVRVINSDSKQSNGINFQVGSSSSPAPILSSIDPSSVVGKDEDRSFVLRGSNFVNGARVQAAFASNSYRFEDTRNAPRFDDSGKLTVVMNTQATPDTWQVRVRNPDNKTSGPVNLAVTAAPTPTPAPSPSLSSIDPTSVVGKNEDRSFVLRGSNFVEGARVQAAFASNSYRFEDTRNAPRFDGSNQLTVVMNTLATPDTWQVRVRNPDNKTSGPVNLAVTAAPTPTPAPSPSLNSIDPSSVVGKDEDRSFVLRGSNFVNGARVQAAFASNGYRFEDTRNAPRFDDSGKLTVVMNTQATPDTWQVRVRNPDNKTSGAVNLAVTVAPTPTPALSPSLSSIDPSSVVGKDEDRSFVLRGSNFVNGARVQAAFASNGYRFEDTRNAPRFDDPGKLTVVMNTQATPDTWQVRVRNPDNKTSGAVNLAVTASAPTPSPSPSVSPTVSPSPSASPNPSVPPPGQLTVSVHPAAASAVSNVDSTDIDTPLTLKPSASLLTGSQGPFFKGLVADGVTPLVIQIDSSNFPANAYTYEITTNVTGGSIASGSLAQYLRVLTVGSQPAFMSGNTISISSSNPTAFAYISGIRSEDIRLNPGSKELAVQLIVARPGFTSESNVQFLLRKPPVALVHGYRSTKDAWSPSFRNSLFETHSADFVIPVEYGVSRGAGKPNSDDNTYGALTYLAQTLDTVLRTDLETPLHARWAFTRYDVVGHSQGGVLLRMLCSEKARSFPPQFRSSSNFRRGRFHRVITIGAPHHGSTFVYYLEQLQAKGGGIWTLPNALTIFGFLQPKFNPFGDQLKEVNQPNGIWSVDPAAKFRLIGTTISGGRPPRFTLFNLILEPLAYSLTQLCVSNNLFGPSRGTVVFPRGSDGIVDYDSQLAGGATLYDNISASFNADIAHAPAAVPAIGLDLFRTESFDTGDVRVASKVRDLLDAPSSDFGPFNLQALPTNLQAAIDGIIPLSIRGGNIGNTGGSQVLQRNTGSQIVESTAFQFRFEPNPSEPALASPIWYAEVYGPSGATSDGVTLTVDSNDPKNASVVVDSEVVGDVIVSASYGSESGKVVVAESAIVTPRPAGNQLVSISLRPDIISLGVGSSLPLEMWGSFENGAVSRIFVPAGAANQYNSSSPDVATVDNGELRLKSPGSATILLNYLGLEATASVTVLPTPAVPTIDSRLANISTRMTVGSGNSVLIGGFIITGTQPKKLILRAVGPSMSLGGALADPTLEIYNSSGQQIDTNNNWQDAPNKEEIINSSIPPVSALESAIVHSFKPGTYTAIVRGLAESTGIGLVEVYDLDPEADSKLANISSRGFVQTGNDVMIGGMIVTGSSPKKVIVRAVGPSLPLAGALNDPTLELYDSNGISIAFNDNWRTNQEAEIIASTVPPSNDAESAIVASLPPGPSTAIVRGKDGSTGVALVEVYALD